MEGYMSKNDMHNIYTKSKNFGANENGNENPQHFKTKYKSSIYIYYNFLKTFNLFR